jgi:hypothetical protein
MSDADDPDNAVAAHDAIRWAPRGWPQKHRGVFVLE